MLSRIVQALKLMEEKLKDIFIQNQVRVENAFGKLRATGEFLVMIHIFACIWLYVGAMDGQWMTEDEKLYYEDKTTLYIDAIYFITTSMTSVGYGEINAFNYG
jgi:hypothetical protein